MGVITRTVFLYHLEAIVYNGRNIPNDFEFKKELKKILSFTKKMSELERKMDISDLKKNCILR